MELLEKDKKAAVLIVQEILNLMDECFGRGENPLSGDVAFTVHCRVKEMADASRGAIEHSPGSYQFLSHAFLAMAEREARRQASEPGKVQ